MEKGEASGSNSDGLNTWAKLEPLNSSYSDIELRLNELTICSDTKIPPCEEQEWCQITREKDKNSLFKKNKCSSSILVDGGVVTEDETVTMTCGSEIILGPEADGFVYISKVMSATELCKKQTKDILLSDSSSSRSDEELAISDSCSSIMSPLVVTRGRRGRRKRARAPLEEEIERDISCPQCGTEYAGFRCNETTVHLQCQTCRGMMPSRINTPALQHCLGCGRAFCGAYWHAMGVASSDAYRLCSHETLKPIAAYCITRIPFLAHERNRHEQDITEKCIRLMGRPLHDVISEWIRKMSNREVDRERLPLNNPEMITPQAYVCSDCYDKLVSFLLYWFRITLSKRLLPPKAQQRDDCWYGYACRTQHHNEEHARKRNHVCRPTHARTRVHVCLPTWGTRTP